MPKQTMAARGIHDNGLRGRTEIARPKLQVGPADDPFEREADRVAEQVMRLLERGGGPVPTEGRTSLAPAATRLARSSVAVRAGLEVGPEGGGLNEVTSARIRRAAGGGRALNAPTRSSMESAFGADFGAVRIHANSDIPPRLGASAFTVDTDIHFAPRQFDPATRSGLWTLSHELAHVVQQGGARQMRDGGVGVRRLTRGAIVRRAWTYAQWSENNPVPSDAPSDRETVQRRDVNRRTRYEQYLEQEWEKIPNKRGQGDDTEVLTKKWLEDVGHKFACAKDLLSKRPKECGEVDKLLADANALLEAPVYAKPAAVRPVVSVGGEAPRSTPKQWAAMRPHDAYIELGPQGAVSQVLLFVWENERVGTIACDMGGPSNANNDNKSTHAERPALANARNRIANNKGKILAIIVTTTYTPCTDDRNAISCTKWYRDQANYFNDLRSPHGERPCVLVHGYKDWDVPAGTFELKETGRLTRLRL
jgi:hypothetical protein